MLSSIIVICRLRRDEIIFSTFEFTNGVILLVNSIHNSSNECLLSISIQITGLWYLTLSIAFRTNWVFPIPPKPSITINFSVSIVEVNSSSLWNFPTYKGCGSGISFVNASCFSFSNNFWRILFISACFIFCRMSRSITPVSIFVCSSLGISGLGASGIDHGSFR